MRERVESFEDLVQVKSDTLRKALKPFDARTIAKALMAASPDLAAHVQKALCDASFQSIIRTMKPVPIEEIADIHKQLVLSVNALLCNLK